MLKKFKKKAKFKNKIFAFNERAGKSIIDNFCVKKAKGDFIVFADSDDAFVSNSFRELIEEWKKIPRKVKFNTFAILSRCLNSERKPLEPKLNLDTKSISYEDLIYKKNIEKWLFINSKIMKKYNFPEIDYYVPEGLTWMKISKKYNLWILDNCYRIFYSDTTNSITHSKKINYSIGQLKALEFFLKRELRGNISCLNLKLINFYRFKFINNFYFKYKIKNKIKLKRNCIILASLFGFILFVKDLILFNINNDRFYKNVNKPLEIK